MADAPTPVLLFDVNETLLDLSALDPVFADAFGDAGVRPAWFGQMLQLALTATVTGEYRTFGEHAMAALAMTGARLGVPVDHALRTRVREGMSALPAHPDVPPALERLEAAGARLATLTNSTTEVVEAQLAHAGLRDHFEAALSADTVGRLKPAAEPYSYAAQNLGAPLDEVTLVAAHAWDVAGARAAGLRTVFVARPGQVLDPAAAPPDRVVRDLGEL